MPDVPRKLIPFAMFLRRSFISNSSHFTFYLQKWFRFLFCSVLFLFLFLFLFSVLFSVLFYSVQFSSVQQWLICAQLWQKSKASGKPQCTLIGKHVPLFYCGRPLSGSQKLFVQRFFKFLSNQTLLPYIFHTFQYIFSFFGDFTVKYDAQHC